MRCRKKYKSLEDYKNSLNPQEKKILEKFMSSPVFDSFVTYLETFFRDKDTIIHRINCYCFRAKENVNIRIHGKIYTFLMCSTLSPIILNHLHTHI
ncbi:hypothetical protein [Helicobacter trogontum]|uniref:Uncharacterized protein n=1 Tax=Helicobacter trogontum TaxID=50960 RepID=A0A4V6I1Z1_9HELI|nr:hypothetical protein [Helicobacter trogontum]MDY5185354.1 hypothetical protein [Helicobacter trogontum]TLD94142.1 hypothetical protein LS80_010415 [Helicobacter trogontum]